MRALWSGSLRFGLITFPIKLYNATQTRSLGFRLIDRESKSEISYLPVAKKSGKPVKRVDMVRGIKHQGKYIVLNELDFKKANVERTKNMDVLIFTDERQIDPKLYEKPYYLEPGKRSHKPYALLREVLVRSGRIAVGRFVLKDREHLVALKPEGNVLVAYQLRFVKELVAPEGLNIPRKNVLGQKELELAQSVVNQLSREFDPNEFEDIYTQELERVITLKALNKKPPTPPRELQPSGEVLSLMQELKRQIEHGEERGETGKKPRKKKPA